MIFLKILFAFFIAIPSCFAQLRTVDIPNIRSPGDIKFDQLQNGWYFAIYSHDDSTSVDFYDENFFLQHRVALNGGIRNVGHAIFTSDSDMVCIGIPEYPDEHVETSFHFYTLRITGEILASATYHEMEITSLSMHNNRILLVWFRHKNNALNYKVMDTRLQELKVNSIEAGNNNYFGNAMAAFVDDEHLVLAYSFAEVLQKKLISSIKILVINASDGSKYMNQRKEMEEGEYFVKYIGKLVNGDYTVIGSVRNTMIFRPGILSNYGVFKLTFSTTGINLSSAAKSWGELILHVKDKFTALSTSEFGANNDVDADYIRPYKNGFLIIAHLYHEMYALFTDTALNVFNTVNLRQHADDAHEFIYEKLVLASTAGSLRFIYITLAKDHRAAIFSSDVNAVNPEFAEVVKFGGNGNPPKLTWKDDSKNHSESYNLKSCNPSIIPSDFNHIIFIDEHNREANGARIFLFGANGKF